MDSATMTSMLGLGENAPPSDELQASPSPQTTIQDLQQNDTNAAGHSLNGPELNHDVPKSSHRCRKPFYWNEEAPEFVPSGASSSTPTINSNSAPTNTKQLPPMQGPSTHLRSFSDGEWAPRTHQENNASQFGFDFQNYPLQNTQAWPSWGMNMEPWLEHVRDDAKRKHEIYEAGWNAAKWENRRINRNLAAARRRGDRAEADARAVRQEMEQANQDALANANVQKEIIAKLQQQVARLEEENGKLTQDESALGSKVQRLEAQLEDAKDTNKVLEDALAKQAEEKKRGEQSPEHSSRLQPPPARKEICTHEALLATLREEKSDAQAETYRLQAEMRNMQSTIITFSLSASQADFELNQLKEKAAELAHNLREQLSFARNSVRQFNRANDTLRDQNSHLETALQESSDASKQLYQKITGLEKSLEDSDQVKTKIQAELRDLKTKHQLDTDGLQDTITYMEQDIRSLNEDKKIDDEDKRRLEHEINCLKQEYKRKITDQKEKESHSQALKGENTQTKARKNKNKKKGKGQGQATKPAAPMLEDSIVLKQEPAMFKELTLWGSKWKYV